MNREQMVEKLAGGIAAENWDEVCTCEECALNPARRLLDAILPQVTTVAELEALPEGSVLIDERGVTYEHAPFRADGWPWVSSKDSDWSHEDVLTNDGPLTVVWQPEVTA